MSTFSNVDFNSVIAVPIRALEYHDMVANSTPNVIKLAHGDPSAGEENRRRAEVELSQEEFAERIKLERADATLKAEQRLRQEYELKLEAARVPIAAAISGFEMQRDEYYARVEAEIVHLTLAIAAKILHREAQVDPMLVATLVRMTVEKLREGSSVTVRVGPGLASRWKEFFSAQSNSARVQITEDVELSDHDCMLETELGVANFGLDTQLKEVEQGFFDLLALKPGNR